MNIKTHKSHEVIFGGRRYSQRAVIVYVSLSALLGLILGSSPLLTGLIGGFGHQTEQTLSPLSLRSNKNLQKSVVAPSQADFFDTRDNGVTISW